MLGEPRVPWATLPVATQGRWPAATPGGHSPISDAAAEQASDPHLQTQPDVGLSLLTSDSPCCTRVALWSLQQGEKCLQRAAHSDLLCCFFFSIEGDNIES